MKKNLGIYVSSDQHLEKLINLCQAANNKGVEVNIFFTHLGVKLTSHPRFAELAGLAKMSLCNVAFEAHNLKKPVPGIGDRDFPYSSKQAGSKTNKTNELCFPGQVHPILYSICERRN